MYDFAREEYVEHGFQRGAGSSKTGPAPTDVPTTQISQGSFILNPDSPAGNSQAHADHMHFQIGPTGIEDRFNASPAPAALGDPKA